MLETGASRQIPVPLMPSSQDAQPAGQDAHDLPKNPFEQASVRAYLSAFDPEAKSSDRNVPQVCPEKPGKHVQVPLAVQIPPLEHGFAHPLACTSSMSSPPLPAPEGSSPAS